MGTDPSLLRDRQCVSDIPLIVGHHTGVGFGEHHDSAHPAHLDVALCCRGAELLPLVTSEIFPSVNFLSLAVACHP